MNPRNLYAILAAGVNQPDLILQWQDQPEFLEQRGLTRDSLDLSALWKFAGLAVKVRHNGLRPDFPVSFRLMKACGQEISLFSNFATFCSAKKQKYASSSLGRAKDLVAFFAGWRDPEAVSHCLLWDMLRHELAVFELRSLMEAAEDTPSAPSDEAAVTGSAVPAVTGSAVPVVSGPLILHQMKYDPADIGSALEQRPFDADGVPDAVHFFAYRRTGDERSVQVLEIDAFAFYTLALSNGKRTLSQISARFGSGSRLSTGFKEAVGELVANGMLTMRAAAYPTLRKKREAWGTPIGLGEKVRDAGLRGVGAVR